MKILVLSDSHGYTSDIELAIRKHKKAEVIAFCGDGHRDIEEVQRKYPDKTFLKVRGNCDWGCDNALLMTIELGGKKLLLTHGHAQYVKEGLEHLISLGHRENADIVLFGHTHHQLTTADSKMLIMNPGSIGFNKEYGLVEIDESTGTITATEYPDSKYGNVVIK